MKSWYYLCYAPPMETCRQYYIDSAHLVKLFFFLFTYLISDPICTEAALCFGRKGMWYDVVT